MGVREMAATRLGGSLARGMADLNARHPWSHNDHFHAWVLTRLPAQRRRAVDIGCGRGELLALLAERFDSVEGTDVDAQMRSVAQARVAGLPGARVTDRQLADLDGPLDLVTMVAVLHHLDVPAALADVRRLLAPGGRFLCVGLAPPVSAVDHAFDIASMVTNPVIGYVKHPWVTREPAPPAPYPVADPTLSVDELRALLEAGLPGARLRRHLGFRHTIAWTAPGASTGEHASRGVGRS